MCDEGKGYDRHLNLLNVSTTGVAESATRVGATRERVLLSC